MKLLRNLGRRKVRTALTILGITIGIWALVVFGSMANKINALVAGGSDYYRDKVMVSAKGGFMGVGGPMDIALDDRIAALPGVDVVAARRDPDALGRRQHRVHGRARHDLQRSRGPGPRPRDLFTQYSSGRALGADDQGQRGHPRIDLARKYNKQVGDTIELRGRDLHGRRHPRAHTHRPGQRGPRAARRRPAALPQDAAPARGGEAGPGDDRDRLHGLPEAGGEPRHCRGRDRRRHLRRLDDDRQGLRQADRLGHVRCSTRSWSASP